MERRHFLLNHEASGTLVSPNAEDIAQGGYSGFFALPIYRSYLHGLQLRALPPNYLTNLQAPAALDLVREPENRQDHRAIAVYHQGTKLGYLPREDTRMVGKFVRRGLPVAARLIGLQLDQAPRHQVALEMALLYPPHPATDASLQEAEKSRLDGLEYVRSKPDSALRQSDDPLSAAHVDEAYYESFVSEDHDAETARRSATLASYLGDLEE